MTIIISDIHLGAPVSKVKSLIPKLETLLNSTKVTCLILNGDIFQDLNFERLKKWHWQFISLIRKWSDQIEIIWICGNHDSSIIDVMQHLVGVEVYQHYIWQENNFSYCAIHGHQFDVFLTKHKHLSKFFSSLYIVIQKIPILAFIVSKFVNFGDINFSRSLDKVREGAIDFAKAKNIDFIFCGHTHKSEQYVEDNITYINTGSWVGDKGIIVEISDKIHIHEF